MSRFKQDKRSLGNYRDILIRDNKYFPILNSDTSIDIYTAYEHYHTSLINEKNVVPDIEFDQYFAYVTEYMNQHYSSALLLYQTAMKLHDLYHTFFVEEEFTGGKREIIKIVILYKDYET